MFNLSDAAASLYFTTLLVGLHGFGGAGDATAALPLLSTIHRYAEYRDQVPPEPDDVDDVRTTQLPIVLVAHDVLAEHPESIVCLATLSRIPVIPVRIRTFSSLQPAAVSSTSRVIIYQESLRDGLLTEDVLRHIDLNTWCQIKSLVQMFPVSAAVERTDWAIEQVPPLSSTLRATGTKMPQQRACLARLVMMSRRSPREALEMALARADDGWMTADIAFILCSALLDQMQRHAGHTISGGVSPSASAAGDNASGYYFDLIQRVQPNGREDEAAPEAAAATTATTTAAATSSSTAAVHNTSVFFSPPFLPIRFKIVQHAFFEWNASGRPPWHLPSRVDTKECERAVFSALVKPTHELLLRELLRLDVLEGLLAPSHAESPHRHSAQAFSDVVAFAAIDAGATVVAESLKAHCKLRGDRLAPPHAAHFNALRGDDEGLRDLKGNLVAALLCLPKVITDCAVVLLLKQLSGGGADIEFARELCAANKKGPTTHVPQLFMDSEAMKCFLAPPPKDQSKDEFTAITGYGRGRQLIRQLASGTPVASVLLDLEKIEVTARALALLMSTFDEGIKPDTLTPLVSGLPSPLREWVNLQFSSVRFSKPEDASWKRLQRIKLHAQTRFLTSSCGPLSYFGTVSKSFTSDAQLATVTDSAEADRILNTPGATQLYHCPNGHYYTTDACPHIRSQGKCQRCGAAIGGPGYGQLHPGNVRVGNMTEFATRRDVFEKTKGYDNCTISTALPRGLTPQAFHVGRILLIVSLMTHCTMAGTAAAASHRHTLQEYEVDLNASLEELRLTLFPQAESTAPVCRWLHVLLETRLAQLQAGGDGRHRNRSVLGIHERISVEQSLNLLVGDGPRAARDLIQEFEQRQHTNAAETNWVEQALRGGRLACLADAFDHVTAEWLQGATFAYKEPFNLEHFERRYLTPSQMPVATLLAKRSPCTTRYHAEAMLALLSFVAELSRLCRLSRVTEGYAKATTVAQFVASLESRSIATESLRTALTAFCRTALAFIVPHLRRDGCLVVVDVFRDVLAAMRSDPLQIPLIYLLPSDRDLGLLMQALYKGQNDDANPVTLAPAQNEIVTELDRFLRRGSRSREQVAATTITPQLSAQNPSSSLNELIHAEPPLRQLVERTILEHFVTRSDTTHGRQVDPETLTLLETTIVIQSQVASLGALPPMLSPFQFANGVTTSASALGGLLAQLDDQHMRVTLPSAAVVQLISQGAADSRMRVGLLQYLLVVLDASMQGGGVPGTTTVASLKVDVATLTPLQAEAQHMLEDARHVMVQCQLAHLPAMLGLLWNGEVHAAFQHKMRSDAEQRQLLSAVEIVASKSELKPFAADFLVALRCLGMVKLGEEVPYLDYPITEALVELPGVSCLCEEFLKRDSVLDTFAAACGPIRRVSLRHYEELLALAEALLGPFLLSRRLDVGHHTDDADAVNIDPVAQSAANIRRLFRAPRVVAGAAEGGNRGSPRRDDHSAGGPLEAPTSASSANAAPLAASSSPVKRPIRWGTGERESGGS